MNPVLKVFLKDGAKMPVYATSGAAGLDLSAALDAPLTLQPMQRFAVPTGVHLGLPEGYEGQVRPRSGLAAKHGIAIVNAPGTIDSDYLGELHAILVNLGQEPYTIQPGDRVAQLVIAPVSRVETLKVEATYELGTTERGEGRFGSTGK